MLKVFDKVYDEAPFLQDKPTSAHILHMQCIALSIISFSALINYGQIFAVKFAIIFAISSAIVWGCQFFSKSFFFSTSQWHISILTYILCLSPYIELYKAILGIVILFILGVGILHINKKLLINPILLGILGASFLSTSYYEISSMPLPYTIISHINLEQSFLDILIQLKDIVVKFSLEETYTDSIFKVLLSPQVLWFGSGSIILLVLMYVFLVITKSIRIIPTLLYVVSYLGFTFILKESITPEIYDGVMWFCAVFLVSSSLSLPSNHKGSWVFVILTALITVLLNARQYQTINFIFALIITNIASSIIENICKPSVFGIKKTIVPIKITFTKPYLFRSITGMILISISCFFAYFLFQNPLDEKTYEYKRRFVQRFYEETILPSDKHPQLYTTQNEYIIYQDVSLYRSSATLLVMIKDDMIIDIEIANISTAHTYNNDFTWLGNFIGLDITTLNLQNYKIPTTKDLLMREMFVGGLQQIQNIYLEILDE